MAARDDQVDVDLRSAEGVGGLARIEAFAGLDEARADNPVAKVEPAQPLRRELVQRAIVEGCQPAASSSGFQAPHWSQRRAWGR